MLDDDFKRRPFYVNNYQFLQTDGVNIWVSSPSDERYWCVYDDFIGFCLRRNVHRIIKYVQ